VRSGLVASLNQPEANLTGITVLTSSLERCVGLSSIFGLGVLFEKIIGISIPIFLLALLLVVTLSRPRTLLRRLSFIAIGFASLLLLNEISLLKLPEYLKPPT
jgi:hypothetical protein